MAAEYRLCHGDCLDIMPQLESGSIDAIIADLPYGVTACKWDSVIPLEPLWEQYKRLIKPRGAVVLFGSQPFTSALVMSNLEWFKYEWVWEKDKITGFLDANRKPLRAHENILVFYDKQPTYNPQKEYAGKPTNKRGTRSRATEIYGAFIDTEQRQGLDRFPRTVKKFNVVNSAHGVLHPTQKPTELLEYLVRTYTNPGDVVLDNTFGSGTTGEACLRTGRRFVGIEMDSGYFRIGQERIERVERELKAMLPGFYQAGGISI